MAPTNVPLKDYPTTEDAVLANINTQIRSLDAQIAELTTHRHCLEQARDYILHNTNTAKSNFLLQRTRAYLTPPASISKPPSSVRHKAMVRSALGRDDSPSPPAAPGLLASDDFEAGFREGDEILASVEAPTMITGRARSTSSVASSSSVNSAASAARLGRKAKKRKLQENAAKAREARRMKVKEGN